MPLCHKDDDRNDVDKYRDDDDDNDNDNHRGAVETIAGESDGDDCYLALFSNRTIRYAVAVIV